MDWSQKGHSGKNSSYGGFQLKSYTNVYAHRFSWEYFNGPIPVGLQVLHKCDNPLCINPNHLFLGTNDDNVKDKVSKNRQTKGSKNGCPSLTEEDVENMITKIYTSEFSSIKQISQIYKVDRSIISNILLGKAWTHVTDNLLIPLSDVREKIVKFIRIDEDTVRIIKKRLQNNESPAQIAKDVGVYPHTVYHIKYGKIWNHIKI